jgi:hypothetical protein
MHFRRFALAMVAVALGLGMAASQTQASVMTLQDLLDGEELVCGDKLFTNFSYLPAALAGDPIIPEASQIIVRCEQNGTDVTVSFQGFWESVYPEISDTVLGFDVYVLDPSYVITGATLFAPGMSATGNGSVRIDETIKTIDDQFLGDLTVGTRIGQTVDTTSITPSSAIRVTKDIAVFAGRLPSNSSAGLSFFSQTFTQTLIPEPSSVVLMGLGVGFAGVMAVRRRRNG